ncbi:MAG TPA: hypothetical protein VM142_13505 [Acidimicrobiales bacterium]|nr:hypothetical protein [Acidimicrobiales bacterium]
MPDPTRTHLALRLVGGQQRDGEIPLVDLAKIAAETQVLVRRLARSITDRSGPGRTPAHLEELTQLLLVGIHGGSTVLEIAGPQMEAQLDLGEVALDAGAQAVEALLDGIDAIRRGGSLPGPYDDITIRSLDAWLATVGETAGEFEIEATVANREWRIPRTVVEGAREALVRPAPPSSAQPARSQVVEGVLYDANLHTGRYVIEDDMGHAIALETSIFTSEHVAPLLGQRVRAEGTPRLDEGGRLQAIEASVLLPATEIEGLDSEAFWRNIELDELLSDAEPLQALEDLRISGLTEEEGDAFLRVISE